MLPDKLAEAESSATHAVMQKDVRGYLVLDSATLSAQTARYAGRNASSIGEVDVIEAAVRQALLQQRLEKEGLDPSKVDAITKLRVKMSTEKIDEKGRGGSGTAAAIFGFAIAFLLYFSIVFYGQNILRGVLEEKMSRVAEVVLSSVSPDTLLAGKVLGVGAVGLTQQLAWVASTALLWKFRMGIMAKLGMPTMAISFPTVSAGTLGILITFFLLGYVFYASLFAAVGAMAGSNEEAQQAAQPVVLLLVELGDLCPAGDAQPDEPARRDHELAPILGADHHADPDERDAGAGVRDRRHASSAWRWRARWPSGCRRASTGWGS